MGSGFLQKSNAGNKATIMKAELKMNPANLIAESLKGTSEMAIGDDGNQPGAKN